MNATRSKAKIVHPDYLALLDVEIQVFGRNREQLIYLPQDVRDKVRNFITDCAIRRAEIGNHLTQFNNLWNLSTQSEVQGNTPQAINTRNAANTPLTEANKALDALVLRVRDSDGVIKDVVSVR